MYKVTIPFTAAACSLALFLTMNGCNNSGNIVSIIPYLLIFAAGIIPGRAYAEARKKEEVEDRDAYRLIFIINFDENGKVIIPKRGQYPDWYKPVVFDAKEMKDFTVLNSWVELLKKHDEIKRVRIDIIGEGTYQGADEKIQLMKQFMVDSGIAPDRVRAGERIKSKGENLIKLEIEEISSVEE